MRIGINIKQVSLFIKFEIETTTNKIKTKQHLFNTTFLRSDSKDDRADNLGQNYNDGEYQQSDNNIEYNENKEEVHSEIKNDENDDIQMKAED